MKIRAYFLLLLLAALVGCVSVPLDSGEQHNPALLIAQNSDGAVAMTWDSLPRYIYTIYYKGASRGEWLPVPTANRVRGTGGTMQVIDRVKPGSAMRRYRLYFEKPN